jgi:hypothetical protein
MERVDLTRRESPLGRLKRLDHERDAVSFTQPRQIHASDRIPHVDSIIHRQVLCDLDYPARDVHLVRVERAYDKQIGDDLREAEADVDDVLA